MELINLSRFVPPDRPPLRPTNESSDEIARQLQMLRLELIVMQGHQNKDRPRRDLSLLSQSDAWKYIVNKKRVAFGHDFFFPLVSLPNGFSTDAFKSNAPSPTDNENNVHHPYFLDQMAILVDDAEKVGGMEIRQQLLWTKHGKWLTLDDAASKGAEPDFSTMARRPSEALVGLKTTGAEVPFSKYEVSAVFEQKKHYTDTDQMEVVDYAQRLLRVQQGEREFAITALFHCQVSEKIIRWFRVEIGSDGEYHAKVSKPASLAPGGDGQKQLLTLLCLPSPKIGLHRPSVVPTDGTVCDVRNWLGRGATSKVYAAIWGETTGAVKILEQEYIDYATNELHILGHLASNRVPGIPKCKQISQNVLFFYDVLTRLERCTGKW